MVAFAALTLCDLTRIRWIRVEQAGMNGAFVLKFRLFLIKLVILKVWPYII